ncbi:NADH-quinone oxidoreductase subunit NuoF [Agriterribacter sp.]|uniref:NADH-quinone oxidoreductase subunit NuoF n=1 Tax=Agriterribacter sp. TaxID=2821509 RepID=UPI002B6FC7C3|nr:NADH-quinone oxidoreductase subunit NuoF [Agriterribacter sp.]HTN07833.1 NADH-quinone oxidoreductase subunit NuoF [Agriterribacter sp.]
MERPLTQNIHAGRQPLTLKEYTATGGYTALQQVLKNMTPGEVQQLVQESRLKGRGGAGFNTGMKWSFVPMGEDAPSPKYLIANADEMEPGTFKDRLLLEGNPHQLIEGMIIAAYAIQANISYVFLRWAYKKAAQALEQSIREAYHAGWLGKNIMNAGFSLDMYLHTGAGRYMCGEETALLNALEGKRATPRAKPPFPQVSGLFGKPTIVNNVETLCCIPHIVNKGAAWFQNLSYSEDGGTKIYGVSGKVNNPGAWELPMGVTMRELVEEHAGGMKKGYRLKGVLPGGASTDFLTEQHLDIKMDFKSVTAAGSRLGTGTMVVMDDATCPVGFVHNLQHFFAQESCGWCTPCREGLPWVEKILWAIEEGRGKEEDIELLQMHTQLLGPGNTFCALAPGAMEPLQSAIKYYREDFDRHIREKKCSY